MAAEYRFLVASCKSLSPAVWPGDGQTYYGYEISDELDLDSVTYTLPLSKAGTISAALPKTESHEFPYTGRDLLFIERNGVLEWAGFPWSLDGKGSAPALTLNGDSIWSWYENHNELRRTILFSTVPAFDPSELAFRIAHMAAQDAPGGPLVLWQWKDTVLDPGTTLLRGSDTARTQAGKVGGFVDQLAGSRPGFDFRIRPYWCGNTVLLWWEIFAPPPYIQTAITLSYGAGIADYTYKSDGGRCGNDWWEVGQQPPGGPSGGITEPVFTQSIDQQSLDTILRMQGSEQLQTLDTALLQTTGDQQVRDRRLPFVVTSLDLKPDRPDTDFGLYPPGAVFRVLIDDGWVQVAQDFRVQEIGVTLTATGDAKLRDEAITLTGSTIT